MWLFFNFLLSKYFEKIIFKKKYSDINLLLVQIEKLLNINFYFFNSRLCNPKLENKIKKIAIDNLKLKHDPQNYKSGKILHIGSVFYNTGGHSRVVFNWIKNDNLRINHILLTRQSESNDMIGLFDKENVFYLDNSKNIIDKAQELLDFIIKNDYEYLILHNHWYDTIPFLALSLIPKQKVIFYNHTDHCATFGMSYSNLVIEMSPKASSFSLNYRNVNNSKYLPMPLSYEFLSFDVNKVDSKTFLSIGSAYKYEPFDKFNFYKDCFILFKSFQNMKLNLIGTENKTLSSLNNIITKKNVFNPIDFYKSSQFYLESYPVGSGLAMLDAISFGCIPIFNKTALTIYNQGSRWLFDDKDIPNKLIVGNFKERLKLFEEINDNKLDMFNLSEHFKKILFAHYNPNWVISLSELYNKFYYEKQDQQKKVKSLYNYKVAKFCTVNNKNLYNESWIELLNMVSGIEYVVLNFIFQKIIKRKLN
jgi:hypothetical protein